MLSWKTSSYCFTMKVPNYLYIQPFFTFILTSLAAMARGRAIDPHPHTRFASCFTNNHHYLLFQLAGIQADGKVYNSNSIINRLNQHMVNAV